MTRNFIYTFIIPLMLISISAAGSPDNELTISSQPALINNILKNKKNVDKQNDLINIVNYIDNTYSNLYDNLKSGKKIVVFFDPAHGLLPNGVWQGGRATGRQSCTDQPEEYYSILLARKLYAKLSANPNIEVASTDEYLGVLKGQSDNYRDISFARTVELAKQCQTFIIVSQHLNNVSSIHKAFGLANLPGIHITYDYKNRPILRNITNVHKGFLTLYNKYDAGGFSQQYSKNLKAALTDKGLISHNWDQGTVGDNRFSYFIDFPVSVIYESGFISHPEDEQKLKDPAYQDIIAEGQYQSMLSSVKEVFAVDISGNSPVKIKKDTQNVILNMKLSRIAVYFIRNKETSSAGETISAMQRINRVMTPEIKYYSELKSMLISYQKNISLAEKYQKKKKFKASSRHYSEARRSLRGNPVFSAYYKGLNFEFNPASVVKAASAAARPKDTPNEPISPSLTVSPAPMMRPIILTIEDGQSLDEAIHNALKPDSETQKILVEKISSAKPVIVKRGKVYSKKNKKYIYAEISEPQRGFKITKGIYIIRLNRDLSVADISRVNSVHLDPSRYQNQLYMKNSYFAESEKLRGI